jgi:hypothetical protein
LPLASNVGVRRASSASGLRRAAPQIGRFALLRGLRGAHAGARRVRGARPSPSNVSLRRGLPRDGRRPRAGRRVNPTAAEHRRKGEPSRAERREHGEPCLSSDRGGNQNDSGCGRPGRAARGAWRVALSVDLGR